MKFLKAACILSIMAVYTAIASAPFTLRFDSQTPDIEAQVKANQLADMTLKVYSYTEGEQNTLTTNDFAVFGYGTNWDFSTALVQVSGAAQTNGNYFGINLAGSNLPAAGSFFYQIMQTNRTSTDVHILGRGIMSVMRSPISGGAGTLNLQQIVNWNQVRNLNEGPWILTNSATWLEMVAFTNGLLTTNATAWIAYGARIGSNEANIVFETNRAFQAENGIKLELVSATNRIAILETNTATKAQGITATNALAQVITETNRAQVAEGILSGSIQGVADRVTSLEITNYYAQVSSNAILAYNTNVLVVSGTLNHNAAGEYNLVDSQYAPYAGYGLCYFSGPQSEDGYANILTVNNPGYGGWLFLGHPAAPTDPAPGFVNYEWINTAPSGPLPTHAMGIYPPDPSQGGYSEHATGTATVAYKVTGTNGWIVTTNWIRLGTAAASAAGDFATAAQGVKADSALQSIPGYYVTNGQDVSLGSISGNGSGITNVNAALLDGHTADNLVNAAATYYFTTGLVSYGAITGRLASLDLPTVIESVTYPGPVTAGQYFASYLIPSNMMPASLEVGEYVFKFYGGHTSQPAKNPTIRGDLYVVNAASGAVVQEFESTTPVIMPLAPEYFYIHVLVTNSVPRDGYAFLLKTKLVATDEYNGSFISYFGRPYLPGFTLAKAPGVWVSHAEYDPVQDAIYSTQIWQTAAIANVSGTVSTALQPVSTQGLFKADGSRPATGNFNLGGFSITNGTNLTLIGRLEALTLGPLATNAVRAAQNNTAAGITTSAYVLVNYDPSLSNAFYIDPLTLTATNGLLKVADRIENNFMLLSFDYITRMGIVEYGMADGRVDTFRNQSGINTNVGKSTNQVYYGTPDFAYLNIVTNPVATGTPYSISYAQSGTNWTALIFSNSATFVALSTLTNVEVLVLGGGGGGGGNIGGGGGAGGLRYISTNLFAGNYTVTVGAGGGAGAGTSIGDIANFRGTNGQSSVFDTWTSAGGGGGGCNLNTGNPLTNSYGLDGGCGGGAGALIDVTTNLLLGGNGNIPSVSPSQGFGGGLTTNSASASAGGGGCGTVGSNCTTDATAARGGEGVSNFITGTWVTYGGGGGGSYISGAGALGGSGGGGQGGSGAAGIGVSGTDGLGGGGGGGAGGAGGAYYGGKGGIGGKGIVIVRYNAGVSSAATNMTLMTTNYPVNFVPKTLRGVVWQKSIMGTSTQNVDFILNASRDNGTTYTQILLSAADSFYAGAQGGRMFAGTVSLTNTPAGSNIVLKVTTSKQSQKFFGIGWTIGQ